MAEAGERSWSTRVFVAGSFSFVVDADQRRFCAAVEQLFGDLPTGARADARYRISREGGGVRLAGPDVLPVTLPADSEAVINELVTSVNRQMLDAGGDRLHLHAGVVCRGDGAVLISARSGTGKTTLVATLALNGWRYVTDESASLARGDRAVRSFPKPVSVKRSGHGLLPSLTGHHVSLGGTGHGIWQVPLGQLGVEVASAAEPSLVVVLDRSDDLPDPRWSPLSRADTVVALVEQSLDFARYGPDALVTLAELTARCRCVHIDAGAPTATAALVEELAADDPEPPVSVTPIEITAPQMDDQVEAVAIGPEAVLHHAGTGRVLSLNPAAARVWTEWCRSGVDLETLAPDQLALARDLAAAGFLLTEGVGSRGPA